jgi:hypothetical protein
MTENSSGKPGGYPASERDGEIGCLREIFLRVFGHVSEYQLMTEFVDRELANSIWDLSKNEDEDQ